MKRCCLILFPAILAGQTWSGAADSKRVIEESIAKGEIPGAVLVVGAEGRVVHRQAYGARALKPSREAMTLDTIFDAASLTKVIATTSAVMKLVEQGRVRLSDPVTAYLPDFQGGKSPITVRHLLTHYSGLRPDLDLQPEWSGYETGIQKALVDKPTAEPNTRFIYSDINFELLGEIVRLQSGQTLADFVRQQVFEPLGMMTSTFNPPAAWRARIAPTEILKGKTEPLRGVVHDPTARYMGGIAGHAGLFTTADDLTLFAQMMLARGGKVFSPATVERFTSPATPPGLPVRGLGWDIDSPYASQRGDLFRVGGFGHTGFTGTSIWIDPPTGSFVILLTNAVHLHERPSISGLRSRIASIAAAHAGNGAAVAAAGQVRTGLDVQADQKFALFEGKRIGLITNHTGLARDGRRNIDLMLASGVQLKTLFSPEHGIAGLEDHENVKGTTDAVSKLPVYSLYEGQRRKPTPAMLAGLDALVFDIQDIGARYYTYVCAMANAMEAAAENNLPFYVLDRPNPINGADTGGVVIDPDLRSYVGCGNLPLRHGMTVGELALYLNDSAKQKAKLEVVKMSGWRRDLWFDETGLRWVNPSPNMRSLNAAALYPGVAMLEYSKNWSVGRGTDTPFEIVGADWLDGGRLADYLNTRGLAGVRFQGTRFTPTASYFAGKSIEGVRITVVDRAKLNGPLVGLEIAAALAKLHPGKIDFAANAKLIGSHTTVTALTRGDEVATIRESWSAGLEDFRRARAKYLLY